MVELVINIKGDVDKETIDKAMSIFGELVINKVKENIRKMDLISEKGGGLFLQNWFSKWDGTKLYIENSQEYATYLEYGTYGYWQQYGKENYPETPHPKKRDLPRKLKKSFPKGMQPFAPVRRVLYNESIVNDLLIKSFRNAI